MKYLAVPLCTAVLLAGCAPTYQQAPNMVGFDERAGPGKLHSVNLTSNIYVSVEQAQQSVLYRAAEVAVQQGKNHFFLFEGLNEAASGHAAPLPRTAKVQHGVLTFSFVLPIDQAQEHSFDARAVMLQLKEVVNPDSKNWPVSAAVTAPPVAAGMVNVQVTGRGKNFICQDNRWNSLTPVVVGTARFIQVPADRPVSLLRVMRETTGECQGALSFFPRAGQGYAFNISVEPVTGAGPVCVLELVRNDSAAPSGLSLEEVRTPACRVRD